MNTKSLPFLNKYFHQLPIHLVGKSDCNLYNQAILVLDKGTSYSSKPYILEMQHSVLRVFMEWFSNAPIHTTNRLAWNACSAKETESIISKYIKPMILVTFSEEISRELERNYPIYQQTHYDGSPMWKGFIQLAGKYFFVYALAGITKLKNFPKTLDRFVMATRVYETKVCQQLNEAISSHPDLQFPEEPLTDLAVRSCLKRLTEFQFAGLHELNRRAAKSITLSIPDFDVFDLVIARDLIDFIPKDFSQIKISLSDYLKMRQNHSSQEIGLHYYGKAALKYRRELIQMPLLRIYLYLHFPVRKPKID